MTPPDTLQTLIDLAQQRHDDASKGFAQAASAQQHAQDRLALIERYRSEYEDRMRSQSYQGIDGTRVGNYARFLQQLGDAIAQQQDEVRRSHQQLDLARAQLLDTQRRLKSLQTLQQRDRQRQSAREARQAQKANDEFAGRAYLLQRGFIG